MKTTYPTSNNSKISNIVLPVLLLTAGLFLQTTHLHAQQKQQMVRIAKIKIAPTQITAYNMALLTQMKAAIAKEPGVLTYYAVADKKDPASITILEIYADTSAYQKHILTPHFKKYKDAVKDMVKSLELVDVDLIGVARKPEN